MTEHNKLITPNNKWKEKKVIFIFSVLWNALLLLLPSTPHIPLKAALFWEASSCLYTETEFIPPSFSPFTDTSTSLTELRFQRFWATVLELSVQTCVSPQAEELASQIFRAQVTNRLRQAQLFTAQVGYGCICALLAFWVFKLWIRVFKCYKLNNVLTVSRLSVNWWKLYFFSPTLSMATRLQISSLLVDLL